MNNHQETIKIKSVIQNYIEGTYEGNVEKLESVFHEKAVMNGFLGEECILADPKVFIEDIALSSSMESNGCDYQAEIESVRIEGNIAQVIISETGFRGEGTLVDYFHLIKTNDEWKIISKLFTTL